MKSSIKVDMTLSGKPIIQVYAHPGWDDLRDKALNMFLNTLSLNGRLCFIDSSGSKLAGSAGVDDGNRDYSIVPINPDHYELLLDEIKILIKERDERFESVIQVETQESQKWSYSDSNNEKIKVMTERQIKEA